MTTPIEGCTHKRQHHHGTYAAYHTCGCRCDACRKVATRATKQRRALGIRRKRPALPTARRIQALVALGWTQSQIAGELGISTNTVYRLAYGKDSITRGETAEAVDALYRRWCAQPAPATTAAVVARNTARKRGWVPPLAWDDIDHDPAPVTTTKGRGLHPDDLAELRRQGYDTRTIADRLGVTINAVTRCERRHKEAA